MRISLSIFSILALIAVGSCTPDSLALQLEDDARQLALALTSGDRSGATAFSGIFEELSAQDWESLSEHLDTDSSAGDIQIRVRVVEPGQQYELSIGNARFLVSPASDNRSRWEMSIKPMLRQTLDFIPAREE